MIFFSYHSNHMFFKFNLFIFNIMTDILGFMSTIMLFEFFCLILSLFIHIFQPLKNLSNNSMIHLYLLFQLYHSIQLYLLGYPIYYTIHPKIIMFYLKLVLYHSQCNKIISIYPFSALCGGGITYSSLHILQP